MQRYSDLPEYADQAYGQNPAYEEWTRGRGPSSAADPAFVGGKGPRDMRKSRSQKQEGRGKGYEWTAGTEEELARAAARKGGSDRRHGFYSSMATEPGVRDPAGTSGSMGPDVWRRPGSRGGDEAYMSGDRQDWNHQRERASEEIGFSPDRQGRAESGVDAHAHLRYAERVRSADVSENPRSWIRSMSDRSGRESDMSGDEGVRRPRREVVGPTGRSGAHTQWAGLGPEEYTRESVGSGSGTSGSGEMAAIRARRRPSRDAGFPEPTMGSQPWDAHPGGWAPAIPEEFVCPISQRMMTDPVIIASGLTYDRASIIQWFSAGQRYCPKSGEALEHMNVCPNVPLRQMIQSWAASNGLDSGPSASPPYNMAGSGLPPPRSDSRGRKSPGVAAGVPARGASPLGRQKQFTDAEYFDDGRVVPDPRAAVMDPALAARAMRRVITDRTARPKSQDMIEFQFGSLAEKARQLNQKATQEGGRGSGILPPKSPNLPLAGPGSQYAPTERATTPESLIGVWESIRTEGVEAGPPGSRGGRSAAGLPVLAHGGGGSGSTGSDLNKGGSMKMTRKERDRMLAELSSSSQGAESQAGLEGALLRSRGRTSSKGAGSNRWERVPSGDGLSDQGSPYPPPQYSPQYSEGGYPPAGTAHGAPVRSPSPYMGNPLGGAGSRSDKMSRGSSGTGWPGVNDSSPLAGEDYGEVYGYRHPPDHGNAQGQEGKIGLVRTSSVPSDFMDHLDIGRPPADIDPAMEATAEYVQKVKTRALVKSNTERTMDSERVPQRPGRGAGASPFSEGAKVGASRFASGGRGGGRPPSAGKGGGAGGGSEIDQWVDALRFGNDEERRAAAKEIRSAVKGSADNKAKLVEAEGIPPLVDALVSPDQELVEHAMMSLMNMALHWNSCNDIVMAGGITLAVKVLSSGTSAAKGYAAALLFAASKEEENKLSVRAAGAIPPLLSLLNEGTLRSKKDAALALYTLSTSGRCARDIIKAGAIQTLLKLVENTDPGLEEKAVALIANLCRFAEGCQSAADAGGMTRMVDLLEEGSTMRVKEDAAAILLQMCASGHITHAQLLAEGVLPSLVLISQSSTSTSEAKTLLEILRKKSQERAGKS